MSRQPDPIRRLPRPDHVHAHIGRLLRELRFARRLYKLTQAVNRQRQEAAASYHSTPNATQAQGVTCG